MKRLFVLVIGVLVLASAFLYLWLALAASPYSLINELSGLLFILGAIVVGGLIIFKRPENKIGWLFSGVGLLWLLSNNLLLIVWLALTGGEPPDDTLRWLALLGSWTSDIAWIISASFLFLLFPDGRLPSPWWRTFAWLMGGMIVVGLLLNLVTPGPLSQFPAIDNPLGITKLSWLIDLSTRLDLIFMAGIFICFGSVFARYAAAEWTVRKQIKWIAFLALLTGLILIGQELIRLYGDDSTPALTVLDIFGAILFGAMPLIVGVAILRHQLFDIDLFIRKTLLYTTVTGLLVVTYSATVVVLQSLIGRASQQQSPLVIVISTLVIAALFTPLRSRLQTFIDRRFFRQKYDAQQVLAHFGQTARDEVSLDALAAELLRVVQETVEPAPLLLWLPKSNDRPK